MLRLFGFTAAVQAHIPLMQGDSLLGDGEERQTRRLSLSADPRKRSFRIPRAVHCDDCPFDMKAVEDANNPCGFECIFVSCEECPPGLHTVPSDNSCGFDCMAYDWENHHFFNPSTPEETYKPDEAKKAFPRMGNAGHKLGRSGRLGSIWDDWEDSFDWDDSFDWGNYIEDGDYDSYGFGSGSGGGDYHYTSTDWGSATDCPADVRTCADGTFVSRNPDLDCDFDLCPAPATTQPENAAVTDLMDKLKGQDDLLKILQKEIALLRKKTEETTTTTETEKQTTQEKLTNLMIKFTIQMQESQKSTSSEKTKTTTKTSGRRLEKSSA